MVPEVQLRSSKKSPLLLSPLHRVAPRIPVASHARIVNLEHQKPDSRALDRFGIEAALRLGLLPLRPAGAVTPVAGARRTDFDAALPELEKALGPVAYCRAERHEIEAHIASMRAPTLSARAAARTALPESCRGWSGRKLAVWGFIFGSLVFGFALATPQMLAAVLTLWATVTLMSVTALRSVAALVELNHARRLGQNWASQRTLREPGAELPFVSLLVPLCDEQDIAPRLVERLCRLDYDRNRLETLLILEADDHRTNAALENARLPDWMRVIRVPAGGIRTKPRALNYALDFARGDIVGVYDAEDAPAPDQLLKVAKAFRTSGPRTACVQGVLDFYNTRESWLTRCFTIDYATWFRLVLPGLVRLGLPIPLGGTTVFFRRHVLDRIGRWDAHNLTEDADLGIRLSRRGYHVAFIPTVTEEEATASVPAWIRQRSRWIKGYAVTWAVHMRDPLRLLGELGPLRFLCVQILLFGTLSQFILAPFLWSFWLILFGLPHPVAAILPWTAIVLLGVLFLLSEVATLAIAAFSVATPRHRWLIKWVPVMHLYFPLAAIASWKGYAELIWKPFFWDKTAHGGPATQPPADLGAPHPPHPA